MEKNCCFFLQNRYNEPLRENTSQNHSINLKVTPMPANHDPKEIEKFSQLAHMWWDASGPCKPLHDINPLRMGFVNEHTELKDKQVLDLGCGGGILSETLTKAGAHVTAIDLSEEAITAAKQHARESNLPIDYRVESVEALAKSNPQSFDVITCMEMLEHVPDPAAILKSCVTLLKPDGDLFLSTLNRSLKSYVQAILGAEYLLRLLPVGTHDYAKFIKPSELANWLRTEQLDIKAIQNLDYNPLSKEYRLTTHQNPVNYLVHARFSF